MRRRLLILAAFLLAGAVLNVAVAWGCALWSPALKTDTIDDETYRAWGIGWSTTMWVYMHGDNAIIEAGFPLACVAGEFGSSSGLGFPQSYWTRSLIGWELTKRYPKPHRPFPIRPLWIGCATNSLFFTGVLWLSLSGFFLVRRRLRVKRGLCPACAYPLGESAVCSECGRALP